MLRRIVLVGSGALALSAVIMAPGIAAAKPITGNVSCTLKGSAVITPGLPLTATDPPTLATKTLKSSTVFTGTLENCTGAQVNTKGGAQIDHGTVVAKGKTKYEKGTAVPNCIDLQNPTVRTVLKATVTFMDATGNKIAKSVANLTVGNATIAAQVSFPATGPVTGGNAFKGETATSQANLDGGAANVAAACVGGASTTFSFTDGTSTTEIH